MSCSCARVFRWGRSRPRAAGFIPAGHKRCRNSFGTAVTSRSQMDRQRRPPPRLRRNHSGLRAGVFSLATSSSDRARRESWLKPIGASVRTVNGGRSSRAPRWQIRRWDSVLTRTCKNFDCGSRGTAAAVGSCRENRHTPKVLVPLLQPPPRHAEPRRPVGRASPARP